MTKIDASVPRKMMWADRIPNKHRCPFCKSRLERQYQTYLFVVQDREETPAFVSGCELGAFCPNCPLVVFDSKEVGNMVANSFVEGKQEVIAFHVAGIVNVDAIPDDKKDQPIGGDDNPLPLVEFIDKIEIPASAHPEGKRLSGNQRRRMKKAQSE
jgi:hypothetical protein